MGETAKQSTLFLRAQKKWPGVRLSEKKFLASLEHAGAVQSDDVFLALAAAAGDPSALAHMHRLLCGVVKQVVTRLRLPKEREEDIVSDMAYRLLVEEGGVVRIAGYQGRGALKKWLEIACMRWALEKYATKKLTRLTEEEALPEKVAGSEAPELALFKAQYGSEFKEVFLEAFGALSAAERNLLRQHYLQGLSNEALAKYLNVSRATLVRQMTAARAHLLDDVRRRLSKRARIDESQVNSAIFQLKSKMDITLSALLKTPISK